MSKITRNSKSKLGYKNFTCSFCDSHFMTTVYKIVKSEIVEEFTKGWFIFVRYYERVTPVYRLTARCPVCQEEASINVPTGEPVITRSRGQT